MSHLSRKLGLTFVFTSLSVLGFWTIFGNYYVSGAAELNSNQSCPKPPTFATFSQNRYIGLPSFDLFLCEFVAFFNATLDPSIVYYAAYFFLGLAPVIAIYQIEGTRRNGARFFSPTIFGLLYQSAGGGSMIPLELIPLLVSSISSPSGSHDAPQPLTASQAWSIHIALVLGYLVPTTLMLKSGAVWTILLWQPFPLLVTLVQTLWLRFTDSKSLDEPSKNNSEKHRLTKLRQIEDGLSATRTLLQSMGLCSTLVHLFTLRTISKSSRHSVKNPLNLLHQFINWLPQFSVAKDSATALGPAVLRLLQWDSIFTFIAVILAGILLQERIRGLREIGIYVIGVVLGSLVLGPGAVIAGLWMMRESSLAAYARAEIGKVKRK